jgi:hypothetical protein
MKYIVGLLIIAAGTFMVWRTDWMMKNFGRVAWAEQKLGNGGTWSFYKILGVGGIILALLIMTGTFTSILDFIFR